MANKRLPRRFLSASQRRRLDALSAAAAAKVRAARVGAVEQLAAEHEAALARDASSPQPAPVGVADGGAGGASALSGVAGGTATSPPRGLKRPRGREEPPAPTTAPSVLFGLYDVALKEASVCGPADADADAAATHSRCRR